MFLETLIVNNKKKGTRSEFDQSIPWLSVKKQKSKIKQWKCLTCVRCVDIQDSRAFQVFFRLANSICHIEVFGLTIESPTRFQLSEVLICYTQEPTETAKQ